MAPNSFLSDKNSVVAELSPEQRAKLLNQLLKEQPIGREIDLNKPVIIHTRYQQFPQLVYHHETGHVLTVADEKQLKAAQKRGYKEQPSPDHDYSKVRSGRAERKAVAQVEEAPLTAEELAAIEEEEAEN